MSFISFHFQGRFIPGLVRKVACNFLSAVTAFGDNHRERAAQRDAQRRREERSVAALGGALECMFALAASCVGCVRCGTACCSARGAQPQGLCCEHSCHRTIRLPREVLRTLLLLTDYVYYCDWDERPGLVRPG